MSTCFTGNLHDFDKMMIEKWPIVQAYALDEYTGYVEINNRK